MRHFDTVEWRMTDIQGVSNRSAVPQATSASRPQPSKTCRRRSSRSWSASALPDRVPFDPGRTDHHPAVDGGLGSRPCAHGPAPDRRQGMDSSRGGTQNQGRLRDLHLQTSAQPPPGGSRVSRGSGLGPCHIGKRRHAQGVRALRGRGDLDLRAAPVPGRHGRHPDVHVSRQHDRGGAVAAGTRRLVLQIREIT